MPSSPFPVFVTYQKGDTVHGGASKNTLFVLTLGPLCSASHHASLLLPHPLPSPALETERFRLVRGGLPRRRGKKSREQGRRPHTP